MVAAQWTCSWAHWDTCRLAFLREVHCSPASPADSCQRERERDALPEGFRIQDSIFMRSLVGEKGELPLWNRMQAVGRYDSR